MWGRHVILPNSGFPLCVTADGRPEWLTAGATIAWDLVTAPGSPVTLNNGTTIPAGQKYLRYGQVLTRVTLNPTQTVTLGGAPTGGTFTLVVVPPYWQDPNQNPVTTGTIAFNSSAAAFQAVMDAAVGAGNTTVTGTGPYTVAFNYAQATLMTLGTNALTPSGTVTIAAGTSSPDIGFWGPFDPAATDGRQTLTLGQCGILNETIIQNGILGFTTLDTDHTGLIVGGRLFKGRVLATSGTHSLAAGPTYAELQAVLPRVFWSPEQ